MLLEEAIKIHTQNQGKIDILELLGIKLGDNNFNENYYTNKIEHLKKGNYFISDLDGTFFRGMVSQEVFSLFVKYVKTQDILNLDLNIYKEFLDDNKYFHEIEKKAYNKTIPYNDYINTGTFLLFKYQKLINWEEFLIFVEKTFKKKELVNPYRFSLNKMKEELEKGNNFLFVSGCPDFALDIYLNLLKGFIAKVTGKDYGEQINAVGTYIGIHNNKCIPLFGRKSKQAFIEKIQNEKEIKIIGGMGDTSSDYGISHCLNKGSDFYFINPEKSVINNYSEFSKKGINYHFISERKDLIYELDIKKINIINL